jgi:Fe-S cluster assembly protein SufD
MTVSAAIPSPTSERWKYTDLSRALKGKALSPAALGWGTDVVPMMWALPDDDLGLWAEMPSDVRIIGGDADITITGRDGGSYVPCLVVNIPSGSEATVIERHDGTGAYWNNMRVQIHVAAGARLTHYRLMAGAPESILSILTHVRAERDAHYTAFLLIAGAGVVRNQIEAEIVGAGAEVALNGVNLLSGTQHADTTIRVTHQAPNTRSWQTYKNVLAGQARGVFQGKIHVERSAQKTDGYQLSNTLMLSSRAEMDVKPELEIYADDVKCSHGATSGKVDDTALFYLRARGIPEAKARLMLVEAFVRDVIDSAPHESARQEMEAIVSQWLSANA